MCLKVGAKVDWQHAFVSSLEYVQKMKYIFPLHCEQTKHKHTQKSQAGEYGFCVYLDLLLVLLICVSNMGLCNLQHHILN